MKAIPVIDMKNIGKTVALRLSEIGITTSKQLAAVGAAGAYKKLSKQYPGQHLPVCYYLYSLEGALQDKHWDAFSERQKANLRQKAGVGEAK